MQSTTAGICMHCVLHRYALDPIIEEIFQQPLGTTSFSLLYWVVYLTIQNIPGGLSILLRQLGLECI